MTRAPRVAAPPDEIGPNEPSVIGIDGEGHTDARGRHRYVYMSASTSRGLVSEIEDRRGLRTKDVLDWLLSLPRKPKKVGYSLGYDETKWFQDLGNHEIYSLWRPDSRQGRHGPKPLRVPLGSEIYQVNLVATRLTIAKGLDESTGKFSRRQTIWDVFKFFQRSFVSALEQWDVGTKEEREAIQKMKDRRGSFRGISRREKLYCQAETRLLALLVEKLLAACDDAGLDLRDLYGPGSLAAAMLSKGKAKAQIVDLSARPELRDPVQRAFFGGRFEINRIGPLRRARSYDLASAYPCAETQLPCLACGTWRRVVGQRAVDRALRSASAALVRWSLPEHPDITTQPLSPNLSALDLKAFSVVSDLAGTLRTSTVAWGPFPYRTRKGAILFPVVCPSGGWVYHHEYLVARRHRSLWPNVRALEALVYETRCDCGQPYLEEVASAYNRRLEWGKEGKGITLKLAVNSRYGKRAQSSGSHPFRCLLAAGLITSHCRAAILEAIARARRPEDVVSVATDGIISSRPIVLPDPPRTGTEIVAKKLGKSPLGEWEEKAVPGGVFLIRPGMRFALDLDKKIGTTAARGLGVRTLHQARKKVLAKWKRFPRARLSIQQPAQFRGAKLSISVRGARTDDPTYRRSEEFGTWVRPDPYRVSYEPLPKRPALRGNRILSWALSAEEPPSAPYDRKVSQILNRDLDEAEDVADAQPDREPSPVVDDLDQ